MNKPIVVLGIGELGAVFSRAFLRNNFPVYPVNRDTEISDLASQIDPEMILVCTGEKDLPVALASIPDIWKDRVAMMQNELLPRDWELYDFVDPTIISVWFEKKKGMDSKVLISSPTFGNKAELLVQSLALIDIPANVVGSFDDLVFELVLKNVYILTTNIAGLMLPEDSTVDDLRNEHHELMQLVITDVLALQEKLSDRAFDIGEIQKSLMTAFEGDLKHKCMGRSALARLQRALALAEQFDIEVPTLDNIFGQLGSNED